jgi:hypothetical protein
MRQVQCFRIFALLDPDSESGSTDLIESGSNPDPKTGQVDMVWLENITGTILVVPT